jgi:hypothetical protein
MAVAVNGFLALLAGGAALNQAWVAWTVLTKEIKGSAESSPN